MTIMKVSFIIFVVLIVVILDLIEASPVAQAQGFTVDSLGMPTVGANKKDPVTLDDSPIVCNINKKGLPISNGKQSDSPTCAKTQLGEIPGKDKMASSLILFPPNGGTITANRNFTAKVKVQNLNTGFFDNAATQYYSFSQRIADNGFINGHSHITIQNLGDIKNPVMPDASKFQFFLGLNVAADGNGVLSADVGSSTTAGLPAGAYRMCTMSASLAHTPLIMPVAQRGSQDDCIRFSVK